MLLYRMQNSAIFLMGPTAAGKSALAMQLAQRVPVDIISVDSAMVYRGMDIGTGKPSPQELQRFPHQLVDICDPSFAYSAAQFCLDAKAAMQQSWQQQRVPLLVGGTMLYFKALQFGLADLPAANPQLRAQLSAQAQTLGWQAMHAKLSQLDPVTAQRISQNDPQRIQRALEINLLTGKTLQANYTLASAVIADKYTIHSFAIMPSDRSALHTAIAQRFDAMLDAGLIAEVTKLYQRGDLDPQLPSMRAVGYRQVWNYLDQQIDYATMREQAIAATRQLAKRQFTWLRSWPQIISIDSVNSAALDVLIQTVLHSLEHNSRR